jgi:hypothetical protein
VRVKTVKAASAVDKVNDSKIVGGEDEKVAPKIFGREVTAG